MTNKSLIMATVALVGVALVLGGCETPGRTAGTGAGIGAATGAVIGHQRGRAIEGALIGAAVGGLTGLIAHDVQARRAATRQETIAKYAYEPVQGEMMTMENAQVMPSVVRPGLMAEMSMQYALLGAGEGASVVESRHIRHRGDVLWESTRTMNRGDGTWVSTQQFELPRNAAPGQYTVVQSARTNQSSISSTATFTVQE